MPEFGPVWDAVAKLGLALTLGAALWYFVLSPRKTPTGDRKSSLLVPGWIHDDAVAEVERVRTFYEKMLKDAQNASNNRVNEWRGFRDEERAKRVDAENDSKAVVAALNTLADDVKLLLDLQKMAQGDGRLPEETQRRG